MDHPNYKPINQNWNSTRVNPSSPIPWERNPVEILDILQNSRRTKNLHYILETHNGYNLVRTESFCDLVRTGLGLVPDGLLLDEEDSTDQTSTSESIPRTHTSD